MPQSADEIDFSTDRVGDTGWAEWQESITVWAASREELFSAAKYALAVHDYEVKRGEIGKGMVIGEHGMTAFDWNIVAGIYFKEQDDGKYKVRILIEGSKDIGFGGDDTGGASPQAMAAALQSRLSPNPSVPPVELRPSVVQGSGFFVSDDGLIATSYHVIEDAVGIQVTTRDGTVLPAVVVSTSPSTDLALLRVELQGNDFLSLSESGEYQMGDWVFTVGYPVIEILGATPKFTEGSISSLSGPYDEAAFIQVSIPIQPGNSGGPVANIAGEVVGVIVSTAAVQKFLRETGSLPQSINWAVKADYLSLLVNPAGRQESVDSRKGAIARVSGATCHIRVDRL